MNQIVPAGGAPLDALAVQIRREHELAEARWRDAVGHAIRAGELLIEAKGQVRHGEWLPWLEGNVPFAERTAQLYMRLARESATVADLPTVREAMAALTVRTGPDADRLDEWRDRYLGRTLAEARALLADAGWYQALAIRRAARCRDQYRGSVNDVGEIKVWAERRLGQILNALDGVTGSEAATRALFNKGRDDDLIDALVELEWRG